MNACPKVDVSKLHVTFSPSSPITHGFVTIHAWGPASYKISKIGLVIYAAGNAQAWQTFSKGPSATFKLNVANANVWGINPGCGCTYGHHRVIVTFYLKCGKHFELVRIYLNNDPLKKHKKL